MQIHVALYRWKEGVPNQEIEEALALVERIQPEISGIVEISTGENTSKYSEGYTHVILVRGIDQDAIDAYRNHPLHKIAAEKIEAIEESGIGVDFKTNTRN